MILSYKHATLTIAALAVAASSFARPTTPLVAADTSKMINYSAEAAARVVNGKIVGPIIPLTSNPLAKDAPVFTEIYNNAQLNPAVFPASISRSYKFAPGGVAPAGYPASPPLFTYGTSAYQNCFAMDDVNAMTGMAGKPIRGFWTAYRYTPGLGDGDATDTTRWNLILLISSTNDVDLTGNGPSFVSENDGVALFYSITTFGGFYGLRSDLSASGLQLNMPANGGGLAMTAFTFDGPSSAPTNVRAISATGIAYPAWTFNFSATGGTNPVGTNTATSDKAAWEDDTESTWDGVVANYVNRSDYQHDDLFTTQSLGANAWAELYVSPLTSAPYAGTDLVHCWTVFGDSNLRTIKGTVKLTGMVDPASALIPEFSTGVQVDAKADDRTVPLVHVSGDVYSYELVDLTPTGAGGVRNLSFKVPGFLRRNISVNTTGGSVTNANVVLPNGEANDDTTVDFFDYLIVSAGYESAFPDAAYIDNFTADFTRDGTIDFFDFLLLNDSYELEDDPELP